jgi:hypothetical protein
MTDGEGSADEARAQRPSKYKWGWHVGLMALLPIAAGAAAYNWSPAPNEGFASAAAALAMIGAAAVGIERALELLWSVVDNSKLGGWWPLREVRQRILDFESETQKLLAQPAADFIGALEAVRDAADTTSEEGEALVARINEGVATGLSTLNQLSERLKAARQLAPGSPRLTVIQEVKNETIDLYTHVANQTGAVSDALNDAIGQLSEISGVARRLEDGIEAFSDNPARRIASILLGVTIGLAVAGWGLGLNVFLAVEQSETPAVDGSGASAEADIPESSSTADTSAGAETTVRVVPAAETRTTADDEQRNSPLDGPWGVVLTAMLVGLGSNPTHEVIKVLQRRKQRDTQARAIRVAAGGTAVALTDVANLQSHSLRGVTRLDYSWSANADPEFASTIAPSLDALARTASRPGAARPTE